jgi:hypothetical protein
MKDSEKKKKKKEKKTTARRITNTIQSRLEMK